jgi:hypothetical protein
VSLDLLGRRLHNQRLARPSRRRPEEIVAWLGAVQSQDYPGAKWALAQRATGLVEATIDAAFDEGRILRTHVLRPTWHFVAPADIRWLLALTAPRVQRINGTAYRLTGLDGRVLSRSHDVIARALEGGRHLTRAELAAALARQRIRVEGTALAYVMMNAELTGLVCSGPRRGKQFTYALLEERVPRGPSLTRDEALAALAARYFRSHGPATLRDYAWWSGLTLADAKQAAALLATALASETIDGLTYWRDPSTPRPRTKNNGAFLLPNYDEYLVAHQDRGAVLGAAAGRPPVRGRDPFPHHLILDHCLAGSWRAVPTRAAVRVDVMAYRRLTRAERQAIVAAGRAYGRFLDRDVEVAVLS